MGANGSAHLHQYRVRKGPRRAGIPRQTRGFGFFVFHGCACRSVAVYETAGYFQGYRAAHEIPTPRAPDRRCDPPREASRQAAEAVRRGWPLYPRHRCRNEELARDRADSVRESKVFEVPLIASALGYGRNSRWARSIRRSAPASSVLGSTRELAGRMRLARQFAAYTAEHDSKAPMRPPLQLVPSRFG